MVGWYALELLLQNKSNHGPVQRKLQCIILYYYLLICNFCKALELQSDFWLVDNSGPKEKK